MDTCKGICGKGASRFGLEMVFSPFWLCPTVNAAGSRISGRRHVFGGPFAGGPPALPGVRGGNDVQAGTVANGGVLPIPMGSFQWEAGVRGRNGPQGRSAFLQSPKFKN